jgi:hypothetical protein
MGSDQKLWHFQKQSEPQFDITVYGTHSAKDFLRLLHRSQYHFWVVKGENDSAPIPVAKSNLLDSGPISLAVSPGSQTGVIKDKDPRWLGMDRRSHKRVLSKLNVTIVHGKNIFNAQSIDVSQGGMKLQSEIPREFLNQVCKILISNPSNNLDIGFEASIVESKGNITRVKFGTMSMEARLHLKNFIDSKLRASEM